MGIIDKKAINHAKDYFMIVLGLAIFAFGFTAFILPQKIVIGGVIGLASLAQYGFGWNVAVVNWGINITLLIIAYRTVGRQFVIRTIFGATVGSLLVGLMQPLFPEPLVEHQPFMSVIIGACLAGIGVGMVFSHNGSSAGTDIIAAMVTKHTNVSFGQMMLYCDMCIVSSSYLLPPHEVGKIVYGVVYLVIFSMVSDMVINRSKQAVQFWIFSTKWEDIANAINNEVRRGCTLVHGTGWYTKRDVKILIVLCRKYESSIIQRIIKTIDPDAFTSMANVSAVYGYGFDQMKVRLHKYKPKLPDENTPMNVDDSAEEEGVVSATFAERQDEVTND